MNINLNNWSALEKASGSPPAVPETATAGATAGPVALPAGDLFQLLLGHAGQAPVDAKASVTPDAASATPTEALPTDVNLFIALLPALPVASAATPAAEALGPDTDAAAPPPALSSLLPGLPLAAGAADAAGQGPVTEGAALIATVMTTPPKEDAVAPKLESAAAWTSALDQAAMTSNGAVPARGADAPVSTVRVEVPMHYPEWPEAVGHRLLWAVQDGVQQAELHVNPEHLGPVQVKIHLEHDKADIQFAAATPQAREALETSIPKLREMFAQQGLDLHQALVFSQHSQHQQGRSPGGKAVPTEPALKDEAAAAPAVPVRTLRQSLRLLDDYA